MRMVREGRGGIGLLAVTAVLLVNLHYLGSIAGLFLIAALAVDRIGRGEARTGMLLAAIALVAVLPLAAALAAMLGRIAPVAVNQVPVARGLFAIGAVAGAAVLPNVAVLALLWRYRRLDRDDRGFALVLAAALLAIALAYFAVNLATRNLLPRHMIAAVPIGAAIVASLLAPVLRDRRRGFALVCANAALIALAATGYGLLNKRWETNVDPIGAAMRRCPDSRLYALDTISLLAANDALRRVPAIDHVFGLTYRLIARRQGWAVAVLPNGRPAVPGGACPALLWVEHLYARPGIGDAELARAAGFAGPLRVDRIARDGPRALLAIRGGAR
jgi:hypothetical protein